MVLLYLLGLFALAVFCTYLISLKIETPEERRECRENMWHWFLGESSWRKSYDQVRYWWPKELSPMSPPMRCKVANVWVGETYLGHDKMLRLKPLKG